MVWGLGPAKVAVTAMVGKSTLGSAETGRSRKPNTPNAMIEAVIRVVMTGRRIQSSESVIGQAPALGARGATGLSGGEDVIVGGPLLFSEGNPVPPPGPKAGSGRVSLSRPCIRWPG